MVAEMAAVEMAAVESGPAIAMDDTNILPIPTESARCADANTALSTACDVATQDQLECGIDFSWTGCTEPLICTPSLKCTCNLFDDETWDCYQFSLVETCENQESTLVERGATCVPSRVISVDPVVVIVAEVSETVESDSGEFLEAAASDSVAPLPISFYGLNYNTRKGPDWAADQERCKSRAEVVRDLRVLSRVTTRIRLLSLVDCNQGALVWSVLNDELSDTLMEVWLGLWVGPEPQVFVDEYDALVAILPDIIVVNGWRSRLSGISVGSEAIYREDVTVGEAIANLDATRALLEAYGVEVPVAIVDIAPIYSSSQELRLASDTIMTNTFPFWEGLPIDSAVNELEIDLSWLVGLPESQGKPFVLSEHGWPSAGFLDDVGVASPANQKQYMEESYCYLKEKGWAYYWFTAIDNDWRQEQDPDNTIEGNWGFLGANLELKDHFVGYEFPCPDGSIYSFGGIDWSIPELLSDDPIDPATASCGLWQGCELLAGDCCPTPNGDYLGCCRAELFLGSPGGNSDGGANTTGPPTVPLTESVVVPIPAAPGSDNDSEYPTSSPSEYVPDVFPTTISPTDSPTRTPTASPIAAITGSPTRTPTAPPSAAPVIPPTNSPTTTPTRAPIAGIPIAAPTTPPTRFPTGPPTTSVPTKADSMSIAPIQGVGGSETNEPSGSTPWDDIDMTLPLSTSANGALADNSSGSSNSLGGKCGVWTTLLVGGMFWSAFVGWA